MTHQLITTAVLQRYLAKMQSHLSFATELLWERKGEVVPKRKARNTFAETYASSECVSTFKMRKTDRMTVISKMRGNVQGSTGEPTKSLSWRTHILQCPHFSVLITPLCKLSVATSFSPFPSYLQPFICSQI